MDKILLVLSLFIVSISFGQNQWATSSVLKSGNWYKIKITEDGVYKLDSNELKNFGFTNPEKVRVFGNQSDMLPETNGIPCGDDLIETKILRVSDGIIFYGKSTTKWTLGTDNLFYQTKHAYSDTSYYFLSDIETGFDNLISPETTENQSVDNYISVFDDYQCIEEDTYNLINSGRQWFGDHFNNVLEYSYPLKFPNHVSNTAKLRLSVANHANDASKKMQITFPDASYQMMALSTLESMNGEFDDYAKVTTTDYSFYPNNDNITIKLDYLKSSSESESEYQAWLDYLLINAQRFLIFNKEQLHFRSIASIGKVSEFSISNANTNSVVWDITNPLQAKQIPTNLSGNILKFVTSNSSLKQFITFDGTDYKTPTKVGKVTKQNLHGSGGYDFVIVTHPDFLNYAEEIAKIHRDHDKLTTLVATTEQIYNEFSAGKPDVAAIRNFTQMIYKRGSLKYLLLFGDGSYANKSNEKASGNFIPTYQTPESFSRTSSFVTDDFYAVLGDKDGYYNPTRIEASPNVYITQGYVGTLNIGVGRFPVQTLTEAATMVQKVKSYISQTSLGDWHNMITFLADDADDNQTLHMEQANEIADKIKAEQPAINVSKIFMDAFPQVSSASGQSYPEVTRIINARVKTGTLILNYVGHSSQNNLAHESVVKLSDILDWENMNRLVFFITSSCEFSRFDNYNALEKTRQTSSGEYALLSPIGGAIGQLSAARVSQSLTNVSFNSSFYDYAFQKDFRIGDIIKNAKNAQSGDNENKRLFCFLGDPALRLASPELTQPDYEVVTSKINDVELSNIPDTLKALGTIKIESYLKDKNTNQVLSNFNGTAYIKIFDKERQVTSLANDYDSSIFPALKFIVQDNLLYKGKASVKNGQFSFSFIVPKDIDYKFGTGKISYYVQSEENTTEFSGKDMNGYFSNIMIGGTAKNALIDEDAPKITAHMNRDTFFVDGGETNENPIFSAKIFDKSGINICGNGIGHDLTMIVDNDYTNIYVLNDFYESELNDFSTGMVTYPLLNLSIGEHVVKFKAWDIYNNSSEVELRFVVKKSTGLAMNKVFNYPNPMGANGTYFIFEHNQAGENLTVEIRIYSSMGQLVKTIKTQTQTDNFHSESIYWDGKSDYGKLLQSGMYIYKVSAQTAKGRSYKSGKLILLR